MNDTLLANSAVIADFRHKTPGSARLHLQASRSLPSGIAHDSRNLSPYPIYVERAEGPRKWDVDGNAYVDYFGGHGALRFGNRVSGFDYGVISFLSFHLLWPRQLSAFGLEEHDYLRRAQTTEKKA